MPPREIISWLEVAANAAKVIAVLAAGIWSVFLFISLRKWSRGGIEIQQLVKQIRKLDAEIKQIELGSAQQAVLNLSIHTNQATITGDDARYVLATVQIENKGNRNTSISFEREKPLTVRSVDITSSGKTTYGEPTRFPVSMGRDDDFQRGWVIRAGSLHELPFCIRLDKPGLYQISFLASLTLEEKEVASKFGVETNDWWVQTYIVVV